MEARLLLATLAQRYRLELVSKRPIDVMPRITLTPKRSMIMMAKTR